MNRDRCKQRTDIAGFTLVETLVATLLMGMVLAALATVTAQWLPNWNHGLARLQRTEFLSVGLERLVGDLAAAEFITPNRKTKRPLFEGSELSVTFVRSAIGPNTQGGLDVVRIAETADQRGPLVVRARTPFAPGEISTNQLAFADPVVLLRAPYRLSFAYAGRDRVWKTAWHDDEQLPSAVRLTIRDAATDRALAVSTAAVIHAELPAACAGSKGGSQCGESAETKAGPKPDENKPESER